MNEAGRANEPSSVRRGNRGRAHTSRDIVIVATLFNLLFEYSLRGVNHLVEKPLLPIFLGVAYGSLFTMEEDLIRRFRLRDYHLVVLAFTYGMIYQGLVSGTAFLHPELAGIRWSHSLFVLLVWWGGIQSVLTFYLANRVRPRNWATPPMGVPGWCVALTLNVVNIGLFQLSGKIPQGTPIGYVMMLLVCGVAAIAFVGLARPDRPAAPFQARLVLDILIIATIVIFAACALFLTGDPTKSGASDINHLASQIVVRWTLVAVIATFGYRLWSHRPIPV